MDLSPTSSREAFAPNRKGKESVFIFISTHRTLSSLSSAPGDCFSSQLATSV